ncbi:MAG: TetR/AcrR family transcriptional regulator [Bacillota bacterium]
MPENNYHHGDLKAQLIGQGLKLLDAEGYERFTLRKVAKLCGVSQTAPYRHFHSKDELIGAITQKALDAFGQKLNDAVQLHPGSPLEQLKEMGVAYVRFFAENPEYLRLLFLSDIRLRTRFAAQEKEHCQHSTFQVLFDVTAQYAKDHPEKTLSHDELILYSWGLVHGISTLIASGELKGDDETLRQAEKVIRAIF